MDVKRFLNKRQGTFHHATLRHLSAASLVLGTWCGVAAAKPTGSTTSSKKPDFGNAKEIVLETEKEPTPEFGGGMDIEMDAKPKPSKVTSKPAKQTSRTSKAIVPARPAETTPSPKGSVLKTYLNAQQDSRSEIVSKDASQKNEISQPPKAQPNALDAYLSRGQAQETSAEPSSKKDKGDFLKELLGADEAPPKTASAKPVSAHRTDGVQALEAHFASAAPRPVQAVSFLDTPKVPSSGAAKVVQTSSNTPQATPVLFLDGASVLPLASQKPKGASTDRGPKRPIPPVPDPTRTPAPKQAPNVPSRQAAPQHPLAPEVILVTPITESEPDASKTEKSTPEVIVIETDKKPKNMPELTQAVHVQPAKPASQNSPKPEQRVQKTAPEILAVSNNAFSVLTSTDTPPVAQTLVVQTSDSSGDPDVALRRTEAYKALPAVVIETKSSPTITFSGDMCTYLGTVSQDDARDDHEGTMHLGMGWGDFGLNIAGEANESVQYGYHGTLEVIPGESIGMKENYGEVITPYGVVQFGNVDGVETAFIDDSTALSNGTGAADGSYQDMFNMPVGIPSLIHLMGYTKKATKLSYYSPRWQGFQLGVSYCPNPHHVGWGSLGDTSYTGMNSNDDGVFNTEGMKKRHNLALGLNYAQEFSDISVNASLVGLRENTKIKIDVPQVLESENTNNAFIEYTVPREIQLKSNIAYQASGAISYKGFKIAGGWTDNGSLNLPNTSFDAERLGKPGLWLGDAGKGWNLGGEYAFGCMAVSLAHNEVHRKVTPFEKAQGKLNVLGVEAQVIPGIKLFAEVMHVDAETTPRAAALYENSGPVKNKGTVVMIGSKVSF